MAPPTRRMEKTKSRKAHQESQATAQRIRALSEKPLPYLPQEIQDQIFGYAISGVYEMMDRKGKRLASTTRALLLVSKTTHDEVLKRIYSRSLFHYDTHIYDKNLPITALTDRMMHVEVSMDCWKLEIIRVSRSKRYTHAQKFQDLIAMFGGTAIARENFVYNMHECSNRTDLSCPWPYLSALKLLTGFKTVRVQYDWVSVRWGGGMSILPDLERAMREDLEPTLGPSSVGSVVEGEMLPRFVEFRPREYVAGSFGEMMEGEGSERQKENWSRRTLDSLARRRLEH